MCVCAFVFFSLLPANWLGRSTVCLVDCLVSLPPDTGRASGLASFFFRVFFLVCHFFVASLWLVPECGRVTGHRNIVSVYRDFLFLLFFFPISVLGAFFFNRVPQIVEEKEVEFTDFSPFFLRWVRPYASTARVECVSFEREREREKRNIVFHLFFLFSSIPGTSHGNDVTVARFCHFFSSLLETCFFQNKNKRYFSVFFWPSRGEFVDFLFHADSTEFRRSDVWTTTRTSGTHPQTHTPTHPTTHRQKGGHEQREARDTRTWSCSRRNVFFSLIFFFSGRSPTSHSRREHEEMSFPLNEENQRGPAELLTSADRIRLWIRRISLKIVVETGRDIFKKIN